MEGKDKLGKLKLNKVLDLLSRSTGYLTDIHKPGSSLMSTRETPLSEEATMIRFRTFKIIDHKKELYDIREFAWTKWYYIDRK